MKQHRTALLLAIAALLVSTIAGILPIATGTAQPPASDAAQFVVTLTLKDIAFEPEVLNIPANEDVVIRLVNVGAALHDFAIPARQIHVEVLPGESAEVTINLPLGGYSFICTVPGHKEAGMVGTILTGASMESAPAASPIASLTTSPVASPIASPVAAYDAPGCEGLAGYAQQFLAVESDAWNRLVAELGIEEEVDFYFLEEVQYAELAAILDWEASLFQLIEAPGFAEDWHLNQVASVQLAATTARIVPDFGNPFAARLALWDAREVLDDQGDQACLDAVAACPAFETFWDEWSLIYGDVGTPPNETSDYSSCAGLEMYASNLGRARFQAFANRPDFAREFIVFFEGDEVDLTTRTPTELLMFAAIFQEISGVISKVSPPDYASEWHLSKVMSYQVLADYLQAAAAEGFESADAEFGTEYGIVEIFLEDAAEKATESCAVFAEFAAS